MPAAFSNSLNICSQFTFRVGRFLFHLDFERRPRLLRPEQQPLLIVVPEAVLLVDFFSVPSLMPFLMAAFSMIA